MRITVTQLDAFASVMKMGTTVAAANVLNTSQPSITRALKQLEDATKLTLFERRKGRLQPTTDGIQFFETVARHHISLAQIERAAESILRAKSGNLKIACPPAFCHGFIAGAIHRFVQSHPDTDISIVPMLSSQAIEHIRDRKIDIGIAAYEITTHDLFSSCFTECNEVIVMSQSHRLRNKQSIKADDLENERLIQLSPDDPYRERLDNILKTRKIFTRSTISAQSSASVCAMVARGLGIALLNPLTAVDFTSYGLTIKKFDHEVPFITTLLTRLRPSSSAILQSFVDSLHMQREKALLTADTISRS